MRGCICVVAYLCLCFSLFDKSQGTKDSEPSITVNLTWPMVNGIIKHLVDSAVKPNFFDFYKSAVKTQLSESCQSAVLKTLVGLRQSEDFAVKMFDATGKLPSGILEGTVMDFGSYDECLTIKTNFSGDLEEEFAGQYCMVGFQTPLLTPLGENTESGQTYEEAYGKHPEWMDEIFRKGDKFLKTIKFWFGVCIPSTCSDSDLMKALVEISHPYDVYPTVKDCQTDTSVEWTSYQTAAVFFLSTIGVVVLIGTVADVILNLTSNKTLSSFNTNFLVRALRAFSVYSNTEILLRSGETASCLDFFNGIRFFSATWIILGHTVFFTDTWKYLKFRRILGISDTFNGQFPVAVIENFTIPVGSFFFMSGFLMTYTNWRKLEETKGKMNIFMFFIHKYWRMTPAQTATIALFFTMPLIGSGPIWKSTLDEPTFACELTWWANMFYVQNWFKANHFCLIHTWYLAALMQFHIIAAPLLLLVYRYRRTGLATAVGICIGCTVLTGLLAARHNFPMPAPGTMKDINEMLQYCSVIHIKPFSHISTYIIGMAFGYLILKHQTVKLSASVQVIGWSSATLCCVVVVYGIYGPAEKMAIRALYISLHRIGWALGIGWLTFCCAIGYGGIVNRILSWKALAPLGQLSYLAYLLHPLVLWFRTASLRERQYFGHTELVYTYISHTVVGFFLAYICYVTVELPFSILENMLFARSKASTISKCQPVEANGTSSIKTLSIKSAPET